MRGAGVEHGGQPFPGGDDGGEERKTQEEHAL
jgi:hypothetical protein